MASRSKSALDSARAALLRRVPSVDELLLRPGLVSLCREVDRGFVVETTREVLERLRREITSREAMTDEVLNLTVIEQRIMDALQKEIAASLQPVINASGVILHTNLGRAPLSAHVVEEIRRTATQYSNLEYDLAAGARGKRDVHTARLIERLTGAESAIVVNNCAAAVLLALAALARGGEVIVSRGELIEIGDGFRIPDIMEQSGAVLREVGTTNRTRLADYENAINEKTRLLLRVHPSNFTVTGFTEKPEVADLIALGARTSLPVIEDLGSGCLVDLSANGIAEPAVRESVAAGFSLVLFSGDKLLGGPQAGIIAGKKEIVAKVRRHPLFRALRVDKLTIAALEVTLRAYLRGSWNDIPAQRMIRLPLQEIAARTKKFHDALQPQAAASDAEIEIADGRSLVGGGSTPTQSLPTKLLRIVSSHHSTAQLETRLRQAPAGTPVIARIEDDRLLLDLRTVFPEQEPALLQSLLAALR
ncbi:MAG TPA: L-seryl-tRNA(Sec) selenium transferase [Candidatus Acidoferrales bacterium]|nr:L-seryl-tRNA(Sec) selenium transferase [Candidatus Acidoferrales bacterium]HXR32268.1 L-seryl-tRNA(Sec) selenium transferase [Verrucomicrobiae bacterium]